MSQVLYDVPGPRTRARHRLYSIAAGLLVGAALAAMAWKLWVEGAIVPSKWEFLTDSAIVSQLAEGLLTTLMAAAAAIALALVFGGVFSVGQLSARRAVRWVSTAVVQFFRAVPVLLLILYLFLAYGNTLGTFGALVLALTLYNGSVLAEIFRAGLLSVPRGQAEAAYAIGLRKTQVTAMILAPQALRAMLPAIISQCVVALKDTALGYVIGANEIVDAGKQIFTSITYDNPIPVAITLAAAFIAINSALSTLAHRLEARQRRSGGPVATTTAVGVPPTV